MNSEIRPYGKEGREHGRAGVDLFGVFRITSCRRIGIQALRAGLLPPFVYRRIAAAVLRIREPNKRAAIIYDSVPYPPATPEIHRWTANLKVNGLEVKFAGPIGPFFPRETFEVRTIGAYDDAKLTPLKLSSYACIFFSCTTFIDKCDLSKNNAASTWLKIVEIGNSMPWQKRGVGEGDRICGSGSARYTRTNNSEKKIDIRFKYSRPFSRRNALN